MPMPERKSETPPQLAKLATAAEMAEARFGSTRGLRVMEMDTRALAEYYLERTGVERDDPEAQVTASLLAIVRQSQLKLMLKVQVELERMVLNGEAEDDADALLIVTKSEDHKVLNAQIRSLHAQATQYRKELEAWGGAE